MPLSVLLGLSEKAQQRVKETQQLFFDIRETAAQSPNVPSTDSLWRKNLEITGHLLVENWEKRRKKNPLKFPLENESALKKSWQCLLEERALEDCHQAAFQNWSCTASSRKKRTLAGWKSTPGQQELRQNKVGGACNAGPLGCLGASGWAQISHR